MTDAPTPSALGDLRILDFSRVLAGPFATMLLADLGAEVIKIERPGIGDETRSWGPPNDEHGNATYFQAVNRNKRSVAVDLSSEAGREQARELAAGSDVVVENFRPDVMDKLGLGYETLSATNPRLVFCSITGFGAGDGARLPGYDLLVQAVGGLMSITGAPDSARRRRWASRSSMCWPGCSRRSGSWRRSATGTRPGRASGCRSTCSPRCWRRSSTRPRRSRSRTSSRRGWATRTRRSAPMSCTRRAPVSSCCAVGNDRQFAALCAVLGAPELATDPRFAGNRARVDNREALTRELVQRLASRPAAEWAALLTDARVPAGVVNDIAGAFELARTLGLHPTVDVPGAGRLVGLADPQPDRAVAHAAELSQRAAGAARN